ncbi:MAG: hypothetical protein QOI59_4209 [Gammaproteobacteria bacterium]|jgi:hypothetical protein|nr:hypothetical protein [Gammaproteobacteria bacterium]
MGGTRDISQDRDGTARLTLDASILLEGKPQIDATEGPSSLPRPVAAFSCTKGEAERTAPSVARSDSVMTAIRPHFIWGRDDTTLPTHRVVYAIDPTTSDILSS